MEPMRFEKGENSVTVFASGRISSVNAEEFYTRISEAAGDERNLTLDCEELAYISSAGLRVLLRLRGAHPGMKLVNVLPDVYSVLEMTGFTEIIEVGRALREIDVEGCELIGEGANGKVYRTDPETIVKVFTGSDGIAQIDSERELARKAFVLGVPTAIPYDVVKIRGGGYGSVFELIKSSSLAGLLKRGEISVEDAARLSAELLHTLHSIETEPGTLPSMKETFLGYLGFLNGRLPEDTYEKARALLLALPDSLNLVHGDLHLKNIMYREGEAFIIDMDKLSCGHPVFDLAAIYTCYRAFGRLDHNVTLEFLGVPYETSGRLWAQLLKDYIGDDEARISRAESAAEFICSIQLMRYMIRHREDDPVSRDEGRDHFASRIRKLSNELKTLEF